MLVWMSQCTRDECSLEKVEVQFVKTVRTGVQQRRSLRAVRPHRADRARLEDRSGREDPHRRVLRVLRDLLVGHLGLVVQVVLFIEGHGDNNIDNMGFVALGLHVKSNRTGQTW